MTRERNWYAFLKELCPRGRDDILRGVAEHLPAMWQFYQVITPLRQAHFIAQAAHETDGFRTLREYHDGSNYEGRRDLGNTMPGDGRRFRGRGIFQTTGRANHVEVRDALRALGYDVDPVKDPTLLEQPFYAVWSAGIFWARRNLNAIADQDDVRLLTRRINGGLNGFADRKAYLAKARRMLGLSYETGEHAPLSRMVVEAAQRRLKELGYCMVGRADGIVGPLTTGAIAAFQHDNDVPVTGRLCATTLDRLQTASPRPIPAERANSTPVESRIVEGAKVVGGVATAGSLLTVADLTGIVQQIEQVQSVFERLEGMGSVLLLVGFAFMAYKAWQIYKARVEDHRTGKTA